MKDDIYRAFEKGTPMREIGREFGVSESYVRKICKPEQFKQYPISPEKAKVYQQNHQAYKKKLKEEWRI